MDKLFINYLRTLYHSRRLNKNFKIYNILKNVDLDRKICNDNNVLAKNKLNIAFIIPGLPLYSGGHTSILRLGTYLELFGHKVYYITYDDSKKKDMIKAAKINLPYYKGEILEKDSLSGVYDLGVATSWFSTYHIFSKQNFKYKIYFLQDFEPAFYPEGDLYYLALNTYKMGFHMISLGHWNKRRIENLFNRVHVDCINFPFEKKQYSFVKREINIKKILKLAVFIKLDQKRAPILLLHSLDLIQRELFADCMRTEINLFGANKNIKFPVGKNLGQLTHDCLKDLYSKCHIGVVASFSNISLVPYEMIACGLPVIEFKEGSAPFFFSEKSMIFSKSYPRDFVKKIKYFINNQNKLNELLENAQKEITEKTWENSAKQFLEILKAQYK